MTTHIYLKIVYQLEIKTKIFWFWCYSKTEVICDTTLCENLPLKAASH